MVDRELPEERQDVEQQPEEEHRADAGGNPAKQKEVSKWNMDPLRTKVTQKISQLRCERKVSMLVFIKLKASGKLALQESNSS